MKIPPRAVYLHIPFCSKKCHYCDFTAYVPRQEKQIDQYIDAFIREMDLTVRMFPPGEIDTIFIGGGTPTLLSPSQMKHLLKNIRRCFPQWSTGYEFTVEANPGTTNVELLTVMREGGINRISFGVQTFNATLLTDIGRVHGVDEIVESVKNARSVGFDNLSLDLMFGLPNQTVADMRETLQRAVALDPEHFSCYSLKVEEGTKFHALHLQNNLPLPTEEHEFEMYQLIRSLLEDHGYVQYEISNFARQGRESRHNRTYWRNQEYYGIGTGAHGYVKGRRHENVKGLNEYIQLTSESKLPIKSVYDVTQQEEMENFMILGLRLLTEGVSKKRFFSIYQKSLDEVFGDTIGRLQEEGFLVSVGEHLFLTEKGILFGNDVFMRFIGE